MYLFDVIVIDVSINQSNQISVPIDSSCECEDNNHPDSLDARLFPSVVLTVAPAVTMNEAYSLSVLRSRTRVERGENRATAYFYLSACSELMILDSDRRL